MSLYGNQDRLTLTGTVTTGSGSATVTGSGTAFTTEVEVGDIFLGGTDLTSANRVKSIASNTSLTLTANYNGSDTGSGKAAYIRETPRHLTPSDSNDIYGVSVEEITGGGDNVVSITVSNAGSGYASVPSVTVSGGGGSSGDGTAVLGSGTTAAQVASVTVTNVGSGYTSTPTVVIAAPGNITFNGASAVDPDTDQITISSHILQTGDKVTYTKGSNAAVVGLTTGTDYYVIKVDANTIKLATSSYNAENGTAVDITADGANENQTLVGETATASASLGSGNTITHPGWVKRTVGTGGRAGRINYEVLVASGSISSTGAADAADDTELPD